MDDLPGYNIGWFINAFGRHSTDVLAPAWQLNQDVRYQKYVNQGYRRVHLLDTRSQLGTRHYHIELAEFGMMCNEAGPGSTLIFVTSLSHASRLGDILDMYDLNHAPLCISASHQAGLTDQDLTPVYFAVSLEREHFTNGRLLTSR